MFTQLPQRWNLDDIFPGGSASAQFAAYLDRLEKDISQLHRWIADMQPIQRAKQVGAWEDLLNAVQDVAARLEEAGSFTGCLTAQNVKDQRAIQLDGRVKQLHASYASAMTLLDKRLIDIPDEVWKSCLTAPKFEPIAFPLDERRRWAKEKLPSEQEALVNDLAVDGYHGWSDLYDVIVGRIRIPFERDGKTVELSAGQASNLLLDPDRTVRDTLAARWEAAWADAAELCAQALNHLGGFRLNLYRRRGWDSVLKEPLAINRMSEETLRAMWDAVEEGKEPLLRYLERKAKLLGVKKPGWHDVSVPIGKASKRISYDEAAAFIVEQFGTFSPQMAAFAKHAFQQAWIEAEDRPGKRPGGFCTTFAASNQTRIFMTYAGTPNNVATLAHELGHGFHQRVTGNLPYLAQNYAMNVAETASTFAEMLVADAALKAAQKSEERLAMLDDKLQRAVAFFMNIHARFLFEQEFYALRRQGLVDVETLNERMVQAQKTAYRDALADYHPHFWASKLHFYITSVPFYNFPYTFGYLFSAGVYARAREEGRAFEQRYIDLLRDTGRMTVEELASKHLGEDIRKPDFWRSAVQFVTADVDEFLRLST